MYTLWRSVISYLTTLCPILGLYMLKHFFFCCYHPLLYTFSSTNLFSDVQHTKCVDDCDDPVVIAVISNDDPLVCCSNVQGLGQSARGYVDDSGMCHECPSKFNCLQCSTCAVWGTLVACGSNLLLATRQQRHINSFNMWVVHDKITQLHNCFVVRFSLSSRICVLAARVLCKVRFICILYARLGVYFLPCFSHFHRQLLL